MIQPQKGFLWWGGAAAAVLLLTSVAGVMRGHLATPEMHMWIGLKIGVASGVLLACFYLLMLCAAFPETDAEST